MIALDTTVAVDHLRGHEPARRLLVGHARRNTTVVASEITRFDLLCGVRGHELTELEAFFRSIEFVAVTVDIARTAAGFARQYRRSHSGIDTADYLIAATSFVMSAPLVTTNVKHFPMLAGLQTP